MNAKGTFATHTRFNKLDWLRQSYEQDNYNTAFKKITTDLLLGRSNCIRSSMIRKSNRTDDPLFKNGNHFSNDDLTLDKPQAAEIEESSISQTMEDDMLQSNNLRK